MSDVLWMLCLHSDLHLNHACVCVHTHPYMYAYLHYENKIINQVSGIADVCGIIGTTNPMIQTHSV